MDTKRPKIGVNVLVVQDNQLLLGQRKNTAGDGDWGLPGGHFEWMESLIDGAKRELFEETGLIADLTFLNLINDPLPDKDTHYVHINFLAENVVGQPKLMEPNKCYEWKFFPLDTLPENIFLGHKKIIPAFLNKINFVD